MIIYIIYICVCIYIYLEGYQITLFEGMVLKKEFK